MKILKVIHDREVFEDLGTHEIKQIGDYILIKSLLMGGAIQRELGKEKGVIQLDNRILIEHLSTKINTYQRFKLTLKEYAKLIGFDTMTPILEGHLSKVHSYVSLIHRPRRMRSSPEYLIV